MIHSTLLPTSNFTNPLQFPTKKTNPQFKSSVSNTKTDVGYNLIHTQTNQNPHKPINLQSLGFCKCGRRHFLESIASTVLHTSLPSLASGLEPDSASMVYFISLSLLSSILSSDYTTNATIDYLWRP